MHASLESHKFDLIIKVLNLIWLLSLYVPRNSSFISTQFLVLNLDGLLCVLSKKLIVFVYSVVIYHYYYIIVNLRLSIVFCICSEDVYLSVSISSSFVSGLYFCEVFETLVIKSTILFPIN